ncbi:hypothetical protein [Okeania sp. SIO2B3]|uniref:hypothetical protein n=1 Tax=Okeania sp. SIO2B3 TaxID=2607784 RepID=UPI0013C205F0|nr:hypothetical protein [Okeania sp. SIO2B3]NET44503.1 hypothetical protein [Okeania sp. SIO2B3]
MGEGRRQPTRGSLPGGEDNPPARPDRGGEGETGEMGMSEELGVTIVNLGFFCPNIA